MLQHLAVSTSLCFSPIAFLVFSYRCPGRQWQNSRGPCVGRVGHVAASKPQGLWSSSKLNIWHCNQNLQPEMHCVSMDEATAPL